MMLKDVVVPNRDISLERQDALLDRSKERIFQTVFTYSCRRESFMKPVPAEQGTTEATPTAQRSVTSALLWNPLIDHAHENPPLEPILSHLSPLHIFTTEMAQR
jgi:hypothetical protein